MRASETTHNLSVVFHDQNHLHDRLFGRIGEQRHMQGHIVNVIIQVFSHILYSTRQTGLSKLRINNKLRHYNWNYIKNIRVVNRSFELS